MKLLKTILLLVISIGLQSCGPKDENSKASKQLSQSCLDSLAVLDRTWKDDAANIASLHTSFKETPIEARFDENKKSAFTLCGDTEATSKKIEGIEKNFLDRMGLL